LNQNYLCGQELSSGASPYSLPMALPLDHAGELPPVAGARIERVFRLLFRPQLRKLVTP